jgi:hypothetical protein
MNIKQWYKQIEEWKIKYGVTEQRHQRYDPTEIKLACAKCGKLKHRMARHHKANDYFFANLLPDVYAKRYLEFRKEDIDKVCSNCHKRWHQYIRPFMAKLYLEKDAQEVITKEWCEFWRSAILERYEKWVKQKEKRK